MIINVLVIQVEMVINISLTVELLPCQVEAFPRQKYLDDAENSVKLITKLKLTQEQQEIRNMKVKIILQHVLCFGQRDIHNH